MSDWMRTRHWLLLGAVILPLLPWLVAQFVTMDTFSLFERSGRGGFVRYLAAVFCLPGFIGFIAWKASESHD